MGRRLRTRLPILSSQLDPMLPDSGKLAQKEREKRMSDIENFNRRHRAKPLCALSPGERVWVTDAKTPGTVIHNYSTPRSYTVDLPQGTVRRNRLHLIPFHSPLHDKNVKQRLTDSPTGQVTPTAIFPPVTPVNTDVVRTRSGRTVIKPTKLDL